MGFRLRFLLCFAYCLAPVFAETEFSSSGATSPASADAEFSSSGATSSASADADERRTSDLPLLNEEGEMVTNTTAESSDRQTFWVLVTGNETEQGTQSEKITPMTFPDSTSRATSPSALHNVTTEIIFPSTEGSGDFDTEISSPSPTPETPTIIPQSCFFIPCNSSHLKIHSKTVILAPEGSNITITCKIENDEEAEVHWYRANGSHFQFRNSAKNRSVLHLAFTELRIPDSGLYTCAQKSDVSCCRAEVRLKVYAVPNYKRHLMIIGAVALVCFLVCAAFSVWWNKKKLGKYAKQYKSANKTKKTELLLA